MGDRLVRAAAKPQLPDGLPCGPTDTGSGDQPQGSSTGNTSFGGFGQYASIKLDIHVVVAEVVRPGHYEYVGELRVGVDKVLYSRSGIDPRL